MELWQKSTLRRLKLGEKRKKEEKKNKLQDENIMPASATQGAHNYALQSTRYVHNGLP